MKNSKDEGERAKFTTRRDRPSGRRFIVSPEGKDVIEYWSVSFGRLGNLREFNAQFIDGETIICRHGGALRTLLSYLNKGVWLNGYDARDLYNPRVQVRLHALRMNHVKTGPMERR